MVMQRLHKVHTFSLSVLSFADPLVLSCLLIVGLHIQPFLIISPLHGVKDILGFLKGLNMLGRTVFASYRLKTFTPTHYMYLPVQYFSHFVKI